VADQLTIPVQVLFTSVTDDGLVLDCTVAEEVRSQPDRHIPRGSPFSLVIEEAPGVTAADRPRAVDLIDQWCSDGVVVNAVTSPSSSVLVLRHGVDEVVLEIL
jgi:hypothetical protein